MTEGAIPSRFRPASVLTLGWNNGLVLVEGLVHGILLAASLAGAAYALMGSLQPSFLALSLIAVPLGFPGRAQLDKPLSRFSLEMLPGWIAIVLLAEVALHLEGLSDDAGRALLAAAAFAFPAQLLAHGALRAIGPAVLTREPRRAAIVGMNEQGLALARQMEGNPYLGTDLVGFFDDRSARRAAAPNLPRLGDLGAMVAAARQHRLDVVYLCLPFAAERRVLELVEELGDTTASVYFVPSLFMGGLMQGRLDAVGGMPVVSVCETPFRGRNAFVKRGSDIVLSALILVAIAPLLAIIAAAIRMESPGPAIFRQRRYGLDGELILVSKFRTMTVCEDGTQIRQAVRGDARLTRLGPFLRRTSLDELPQFWDVLCGRMSVVGPRPHAVAHNELYRRAIKGYMVRHKVKPGITGWAQVNGCRGETDTLEKMKRRIDFDLAYVREWSLSLDIYIVLKTAVLVVADRDAY